MERFIKVLRGNAPISESQANDIFRMLIPLVERVPRDSHAVDAARSLIERCLLDEERPFAHVLDWWFVATTGQKPANTGAHRLPQSLDPAVRQSMEAVTGLDVVLPAAEWLEKQRNLDVHLRGLDRALDLDSYGAVRLGQGQREAWLWLREQLDPTAEALRARRQLSCNALDELNMRQFEKLMREGGVKKQSDVWRDTVRRAKEADQHVRTALDLHLEVQPWTPRVLPRLLADLPGSVVASVGPLARDLLRPILSSSAVPDVSTVEVARLLGDASKAADVRGRYRLAKIASAWCEETGQTVVQLGDLLNRHRALSESLGDLEIPEGMDADEVELHVLEDDIDRAELAFTQLCKQLDRQKELERARGQLRGLERSVQNALFDSHGHWRNTLAEIETRFGLDDPETLIRQISSAQREFNEQQDAAARSQLQELEQHLGNLAALGEGDLAFRHRERLSEIHREPSGRGAAEIKRDIETDLARVRGEVRDKTRERLHQIAQSLSDDKREFSEDDLEDLASRLSEIGGLLQDQDLGDDDLAVAHDRSDALLKDLTDRRIHRWQAEHGEPPLVRHLVKYCTGSLDFDAMDIFRLHVALKTKPFVILAGLTGSGKSSLTRLYAEAVGATAANGQFRRIAVRPDWIDQSEVLGFVNPISQRFIPGWLAETVRDCERSPDRLHFVLLDEMNLAPVEQYLAELLSAMEEARSGGDDVRLPLYPRGEDPTNADEWRAELKYPENLLIVGTVNVDETTRPLSERVIDRANVLHLSVEVSARHHRDSHDAERPWHVGASQWREVCKDDPSDAHHEFLVEVADTLRQAGIGIGLRAHLELERFVANADGIMDPTHALDWGIVQRIIPKIRGFKAALTPSLEELVGEFRSVGARQSAAIVEYWLQDSISDSEYLDGTDPRLTLARV